MESVRSKLVVCVDDDPLILDLVGSHVKFFGYKFYGSSFPSRILREIEKLPFLPGLFLVDIQMPKMNGLELCNSIRSNSRLCSVPLIMLTGTADELTIKTARESGASDYLLKPFKAETLRRRIQIWLTQSHSFLSPFPAAP